VAYFSRKLTATERNYSVTDRELLALLLAIKRFRPYVHGRKTKVQTDHLPLVNMRLEPSHPPRRLRWLEHLSAYDLDIVHVPGS